MFFFTILSYELPLSCFQYYLLVGPLCPCRDLSPMDYIHLTKTEAGLQLTRSNKTIALVVDGLHHPNTTKFDYHMWKSCSHVAHAHDPSILSNVLRWDTGIPKSHENNQSKERGKLGFIYKTLAQHSRWTSRLTNWLCKRIDEKMQEPKSHQIVYLDV